MTRVDVHPERQEQRPAGKCREEHLVRASLQDVDVRPTLHEIVA
jgi:hypothetical protein